jgi:hypothetical protein
MLASNHMLLACRVKEYFISSSLERHVHLLAATPLLNEHIDLLGRLPSKRKVKLAKKLGNAG